MHVSPTTNLSFRRQRCHIADHSSASQGRDRISIYASRADRSTPSSQANIRTHSSFLTKALQCTVSQACARASGRDDDDDHNAMTISGKRNAERPTREVRLALGQEETSREFVHVGLIELGQVKLYVAGVWSSWSSGRGYHFNNKNPLSITRALAVGLLPFASIRTLELSQAP